MTTLGVFPVCRCRGDTDEPGNLEAILAFLDATEVDWVLMIDEAVDVTPLVWNLTPEPMLLASGLTQCYPASNALTGGDAPRGMLLCRRDLVCKDRRVPEADVVVPMFCGSWDPVSSPQGGFLAGLHHGRERLPAAIGSDVGRHRLAFDASVGAHHRFGQWWMLGVLSGCLGSAEDRPAWEAVAGLVADPKELARKVDDMARRARLELGLPVVPLSAEASGWAVDGRSEWPSLPVWEAFAERCDQLGADGGRLATAYRAAGRRIWAATCTPRGTASELVG